MPDCHANRQVLPLDIAGRDVARVWASVSYLDYGFYHRRGRVASGSIVLPVIAVYFYHLCEVGLPCEHILDSLAVEDKAVSRDPAVGNLNDDKGTLEILIPLLHILSIVVRSNSVMQLRLMFWRCNLRRQDRAKCKNNGQIPHVYLPTPQKRKIRGTFVCKTLRTSTFGAIMESSKSFTFCILT